MGLLGWPAIAGLPADLAAGQHAPVVPLPRWGLAEVLTEIFRVDTVAPDALGVLTACGIYTTFMDSPPPPPKVTYWLPELPWWISEPGFGAPIWPGRRPMLVSNSSTTFSLSVAEVEVAAHCPRCPGVVEDILHIFTRTADTCQQLLAALMAITGPLEDWELLFLVWPHTARDTDIGMSTIIQVL